MVTGILGELIRLALFLGVILILLRTPSRSVLVNRVLLVGGIFGALRILLSFAERRDGLISEVLGPDGSLAWAQLYLGSSSILLLVYGLTCMIGPDRPATHRQTHQNPGSNLRRVGKVLLAMIFTAFIGIVWWVYRSVAELRRQFGPITRLGPGGMALPLLIPFFNLFWYIYVSFALPMAVMKAERKLGAEGVGSLQLHPLIVGALLIGGWALPVAAVLESMSGRATFLGGPWSSVLYGATTLALAIATIQFKLDQLTLLSGSVGDSEVSERATAISSTLSE